VMAVQMAAVLTETPVVGVGPGVGPGAEMAPGTAGADPAAQAKYLADLPAI
jgi:hypothetical protein